MIAVDTNILVYAFRPDSPDHGLARTALTELAASGRSWAIPWPCVHEFISVVTNPRIFPVADPVAEAVEAIEQLLSASQLRLLHEGADHLDHLDDLMTTANVRGPAVHDARIAAICLSHGVDELWTADRDFSRFPRLRTRNPLVG